MIIKRKPEIVPMAGKVVINPEPLEEITEGGIIIPIGTDIKDIHRAVVVAVGKPLPRIPQQVKYLDTVFFYKGAGVDYELNGHSYKVIKQTDIAFIL